MLVLLAVLFFVVANPLAFEKVGEIIPGVEDGNGPTQMGVALHTVVFLILLVAADHAKIPKMIASKLP